MWLTRKIGSTVLPEILSPVLFFTLIAAAICVGCGVADYKMEVSPIALSVLTTMLSFAISLRTSSAVERFGEGRRAWSILTRASRDFATLIWLHTPPTTLTVAELAAVQEDKAEMERAELMGLLEKRTMINLIQAFSVACKHYLRGESGVYYEDLYPLIACLPRYQFPSSVAEGLDADKAALLGIWRTAHPTSGDVYLPYDCAPAPTPAAGTETPATMLSGSTYFPGTMGSATSKGTNLDADLELGIKGGRTRSKINLLPASNPPATSVYDFVPVLKVFRPMLRFFTARKGRGAIVGKRRPQIESNIPLEISLFLSGYVSALVSRGTLGAPFVSIFFSSLNALQDSIATLERVLTTPLPWAYQLHLRATTYAYLIFLSVQIYSSLGYLTIVATFVAAIIFLGFLELGTQLENPFGYDDSDLDLDHFCELVAAELREIVAHPQPKPSTFVFSSLNQPFLPSDPRSAPDILSDLAAAQDSEHERGVPLLRKMLMKYYAEGECVGDFRKDGSKRRRPRARGPAKSVDVFSVV